MIFTKLILAEIISEIVLYNWKINCLHWKKVDQRQFYENFEKQIKLSSSKNDVSGWEKVDSLQC